LRHGWRNFKTKYRQEELAPNGSCLRGFDRPSRIPGWAKSGRGALPRAEPRAQTGFKGDARAGCLALCVLLLINFSTPDARRARRGHGKTILGLEILNPANIEIFYRLPIIFSAYLPECFI